MISAQRVLHLLSVTTVAWYTLDPTPVLGASPTAFLEPLVVDLQATNCAIWDMEDALRHTTTPQLTRTRQMVNQHRNQIVARIDHAISKRHPPAAGDWMTETPGMVIDRLGIAVLRCHHGVEADEEVEYLQSGLARYLEDIVQSHKRFWVFPAVKVYRDARTDPSSPEGGRRYGGTEAQESEAPNQQKP